MLKIIITSILLIGNVCFCQPIQNKYIKYDYESIAKTNINRCLVKPIKEPKPYENFRVIVNSKFINNPFSKKIDNSFLFSGSYDINVNYRINPNLTILQRMFIVIPNNKNIFYTTGFILKF